MRLPGQGHPTVTPLPRFGSPVRAGPVHCVVCGKATHEGKPWCAEHVTSSPYVREVADHLRRREREVEALMRVVAELPTATRISPHPFPLLEEDVLHALTHGLAPWQSFDRLGMHVHVPGEGVAFLVSRLARKGLVVEGSNARGVGTVALRQRSREVALA